MCCVSGQKETSDSSAEVAYLIVTAIFQTITSFHSVCEYKVFTTVLYLSCDLLLYCVSCVREDYRSIM